MVCAFELLPPEAVAEVLSALDEDAVVGAGGWLAGVDVFEEHGSPRMPRKSSFLEPPETARKGAMSRLVSTFLLWLLLLLAAAPAPAVMDVQPRNHAWEPPATSYDLAPDVRDGPNLYAYCVQNPWSRFDPDGLNDAAFFQDEAGMQTPEVRAAMKEYDRKVLKGLANTPRVLKEGIQNLPKLPGQLIDAAKNPAQTLENIKQAVNEMLHDPEKLGEFAGTLYTGGALSKLSRARAATGAAGATATKAITESAKETAEQAMKTVGRHMHPDELAKMKKTRRVQEGGGGQTRVADPASPDTYKNVPKGDVYVEFDVPADRVLPHSQGTGRIPGPSSPDARVPGKNPADFEMPEAKNIKESKPKSSNDK